MVSFKFRFFGGDGIDGRGGLDQGQSVAVVVGVRRRGGREVVIVARRKSHRTIVVVVSIIVIVVVIVVVLGNGECALSSHWQIARGSYRPERVSQIRA